MPKSIKFLFFVLLGIVSEIAAIVYYGVMVTGSSHQVLDFLLNSDINSTINIFLHGIINGLVFFMIYLIFTFAIKKAKNMFA